jgi:hypothetical protein
MVNNTFQSVREGFTKMVVGVDYGERVACPLWRVSRKQFTKEHCVNFYSHRCAMLPNIYVS